MKLKKLTSVILLTVLTLNCTSVYADEAVANFESKADEYAEYAETENTDDGEYIDEASDTVDQIATPPAVVFSENKQTQRSQFSVVTDYLVNGDIVVISPGENYTEDNETYSSKVENTLGWDLTIQNNNISDGDDVQMWQNGVSDKLRVNHYGGDNYFWLNAINWREGGSSRHVDVKNMKTNDGTNVHVWHDQGKYEKDKAKYLCLIEDGDTDGETFYIRNRNSGLYYAPENYFDSKKTSYDHRTAFHEGKNTVLSNKPYRWRVEVLNRTPECIKKDRAWMAKLPDSRPLALVNIPGTHDAATANVEGSWQEGYNGVACQKYFIDEQLNVGVRAFDLRMRYKDDGQDSDDEKLVLVHSDYICHYSETEGKSSKNGGNNLSLKSVLEDMKQFLAANKSETVIIVCKIDSGDVEDATSMYKTVMDEYKDILYDWSNPNPTLRDVRGKIVAFSRISGCTGGYYGVNISKWDEDYDDGTNKYAQKINDQKPYVYVQDNFFTGTPSKMEYIYETAKNLNSSGGPEKDSFVFNYASYNIWAIFITPLWASRDINRYLLGDEVVFLACKVSYNNKNIRKDYIIPKKRLGITMMDYVDENLCKNIYLSNSTSTASDPYLQYSKPPYYGANPDKDEESSNSFTVDDIRVKWPEVNDIVYGTQLSEASFTGGSAEIDISGADGKVETITIDGKFMFKDGDIIPEVSDSDSTEYTLQFVPLRSNVLPVVSTTTTINVVKCPMDIVVADYEMQHGDTIESWKDMVNVIGRVSESDRSKLNELQMTITGDKEAELYFDGDTKISEVITPDTPVGSAGDVKIAFSEEQLSEFTNYDIAYNQYGTWKVVPRNLDIDWSGVHNYIEGEDISIDAEISNIYNDEDVHVVLSGADDNSVGEHTVTAYLEGADADKYAIPDGLESVTYTVTEGAKEVHNPTVLLSDDEFLYTGSPVVPEIALYDDETLIPENEYVVTLSDNTDAGFATISITDADGGRYNLTWDKAIHTSDDSIELVPDSSYTTHFMILNADGSRPTEKIETTTEATTETTTEATTQTTTEKDSDKKSSGSGSGRSSSKGSAIAKDTAENEDEKEDISENENNTSEETTDNLPFTDVDENAWYADSVKYVYENNIFKGIKDTLFGPDVNMTRGMFVTVLGRMENADVSTYTNAIYKDVNPDSYYAPYINWASDNKIISGFGNGVFKPDEIITREQLAVIITNYFKYKNENVEIDEVNLPFTDASSTSDWALDSVKYCYKENIVSGDNNARFNPQDSATRAEVATILYNMQK